MLGLLISNPVPLRLPDVGAHIRSYGFPPEHPAMTNFLGVPILIRGEAWGNLYLAEKQGAQEFTDEDEESAIMLAQWAGTAIENARLYEQSERRREQAERALLGLEAARDIADAVSDAELPRVLELIVKRGRALVQARTVLIMLREGDVLVVAAGAGQAAAAEGHRVSLSGSTSGQVLARGRPERVNAAQLQIAPSQLGVPGAQTALLVPMLYRGAGVGVLAAFDRGEAGEAFTIQDEQLLRTFAASAANAVAIHRSVEADRLRSAISAADAERGRWARELHDQTLQALGGLRVMLASAQRRSDAIAQEPAIAQAIEDIELEIANLRGIISDLRPSLLDDLGLAPAIDALLERRRAAGLDITSQVTLAAPFEPEVETTIYRVLQEALTNVVKHSQASDVRVNVEQDHDCVSLEVQDNGSGFGPETTTGGFGLAGMGERVYLLGGTLEVQSDERGTTVRATLPVGAGSPGSGAVPAPARGQVPP